ncbi:MAG: class I SAM-dependent methyltransferase [Thaumarchaeota archaeon]|nr:class I SAM-dependent methyltransferase [Nitrososphaerota archaeon]
MIEKLNEVSEFYHNIQFPGHYTQEEVLRKSNGFFLSKYLKLDYLPFKGRILEAGCGTGYTTHVIANLRRDIKITAIDFSEGSLEFANNFSIKNNYKNIEFIYMDLKKIQLTENQFDMVICSGVLHHIENPQPIFHNLCKLVKKNGIIIIGLYHPWGRTSVHIRQKIFKITGGKMRWLDPRIRNENWTEQRKNTWYRDQYEHPYELDYSHKVLHKWFKDENVSLLGSIPHYNWLDRGGDFSYNFHLLTRYGSQGGLYIFVGKKN